MAALRMGSALDVLAQPVLPRGRRCSCAATPSNERLAQVKVAVGPVGNVAEHSFTVKRKLGALSTIIVVTIAKPLGIVFELSKVVNRRIFVAELIPNGNADRAARINKLFEGKSSSRESKYGRIIYGGGVNVGDLLLATTAVNVEVDLFGLRAPRRIITFFDAENRTWAETMGAIQSSFVADGPVTLVFERES